MANLLDKANILITPTAYSDGKIHSAKPIDATADLDFTRGSAATRVNAEGLIEDVASGLPRIDHTGGEGYILLEPQSTNLYLNSETLSTQNNSTTASSYTVSFYGTGTINLTGAFVGSLVGAGANDRVSLTFTSTLSTLTSTVSGSVNKAQLEQQSYDTSYIPTAGTIQTRLEEISNNAGSSDLINSTEGILYADISALANENSQRVISISDGTHNNTVKLGILNSNTQLKLFAEVRSAGVSQCFLAVDFGAVEPTFKKCAIKFKENDFALWIDGVEKLTDTSGSTFSINTLNSLQFDRGNGGQDFYGKAKTVAVFPILTDEELTCLTTL